MRRAGHAKGLGICEAEAGTWNGVGESRKSDTWLGGNFGALARTLRDVGRVSVAVGVLALPDKGNFVKERLDFKKASPDAYKAMATVESYVRQSGLDPALLELVKTRVSQINGCAYCLDLHTKDARANGESEQRLFVLSQWRETSFYSDTERAALAWAEAVTRISGDAVSDELFAEVRRHFDEKSLVNLTLAIIAING